MTISADIHPMVLPLQFARGMGREVGALVLKLMVLDVDGRYFDMYMHWVKMIYG